MHNLQHTQGSNSSKVTDAVLNREREGGSSLIPPRIPTLQRHPSFETEPVSQLHMQRSISTQQFYKRKRESDEEDDDFVPEE